MDNEKREKIVDEFLQSCLGNYSILEWEIKVNEDWEDGYTDFEVTISNKTNKKRLCEIIRCLENSELKVLKGEDFYETDAKDFVTYLFLDAFLTHKEN
jgi:tRNA A37 threonylcarbamoyladenosine biosynthesis protein TsaE